MFEDYATCAEVADAVNVTPRTVRYHVLHGHLPGSERVGSQTRGIYLVPRVFCDEATYLATVGKAGPQRRQDRRAEWAKP